MNGLTKSIFFILIIIYSGCSNLGGVIKTCEPLPSALSVAGSMKIPDEHFLPWDGGLSYLISSFPGAYSHTVANRMGYAWDFLTRTSATQGDEVVATVDGTIRIVNRGATCQFGGSGCANNTNYVVLSWDKKHSEQIYPGQNIESLYLHLQTIFSDIQPGKKVKRGTPLGMAGCTGWCSGIHLHYQVQNQPTNGSWFNTSLPVGFVEEPPYAVASIKSQNFPSTTTPDPVVDSSNQGFIFANVCQEKVQEQGYKTCLRAVSEQDENSRVLLDCSNSKFDVCARRCQISGFKLDDICQGNETENSSPGQQNQAMEADTVRPLEGGWYGEGGQPINNFYPGQDCN